MTDLVANCPRCGAQSITFDLTNAYVIRTVYGWQQWYEAFCLCKNCQRTTIFVLSESVDGNYQHLHDVGLLKIDESANRYVDVEKYISLKDMARDTPPEFLPGDVEAIFREGATCLAVSCFNAAGTMFRLCVDMVTRDLLPSESEPEPNKYTRRNLAARLAWLFANQRLPMALEELAKCIREDGNDGAHAGTLMKADAEDLKDFATLLLERVFTEPERLKRAQTRREARRALNEDAV